MPCYTLVQVEVKSEALARKALAQLGEEAEITKNANGTYTVTPAKQRGTFRDKFLQEYATQVATKKAKAEGYYVSRTEVGGEVQLTLRQY